MDAQIGRQRVEGVEDLQCWRPLANCCCLAFAYLFCVAHHQQATATA